MTNFPTTDGHRSSFAIATHGTEVTLTVGAAPPGKILLELPSFLHDAASTSAGTIDQATGTVTVAPTVRHVTVTLRRAP